MFESQVDPGLFVSHSLSKNIHECLLSFTVTNIKPLNEKLRSDMNNGKCKQKHKCQRSRNRKKIKLLKRYTYHGRKKATAH